MNMIEQITSQKGYDIEIHGSIYLNNVVADIKYPCGELVAGWELDSIPEARLLIDDYIKNAPPAHHKNCTNEYCLELTK